MTTLTPLFLSSCWLHLQPISRSRLLLITSSEPPVVHALVTCHLDYCKSLLPFAHDPLCPSSAPNYAAPRDLSCMEAVLSPVTWPCTLLHPLSPSAPAPCSKRTLQPSCCLQQPGLLLPQGLCICCSFCQNSSFLGYHMAHLSSRSPHKHHPLCEVFPKHWV